MVKIFESDRLEQLLIRLYLDGTHSVSTSPEFEELQGFATGPSPFGDEVQDDQVFGYKVWRLIAPLYVDEVSQETPAQVAHFFFCIPGQGIFMSPNWIDDYWEDHSFPVTAEFADALVATSAG